VRNKDLEIAAEVKKHLEEDEAMCDIDREEEDEVYNEEDDEDNMREGRGSARSSGRRETRNSGGYTLRWVVELTPYISL
jgi:hypothetical protein